MKVALIAHKYCGSKDETIKKTLSLIQKAALDGAQLVCLQELHQGPYFCQDENVDNFELARDFESDCKFWGEVACKYGVVLVTSLFEQRAPGLYHNSAVVFEKMAQSLANTAKCISQTIQIFMKNFILRQVIWVLSR